MLSIAAAAANWIGCLSEKTEDLHPLLPPAALLGQWEMTGNPDIAVGEDLFRLINGGAEIYFEYGFSQAVFQTFVKNDTLEVNCELYEMEDEAAAFGVYSLKRSSSSEQRDIGDSASLSDYYLNIWKGNRLITLVTFSTDEHTQQELIGLGRIIADNLKGNGTVPRLMSSFAHLFPAADRNVYFEGPLAFYNLYPLTPENIFSPEQGVYFSGKKYTCFCLSYTDTSRQKEIFHAVSAYVRKNVDKQSNTGGNEHFSFTAPNGEKVVCSLYKDYILLCSAETEALALRTVEKFRQ